MAIRRGRKVNPEPDPEDSEGRKQHTGRKKLNVREKKRFPNEY